MVMQGLIAFVVLAMRLAGPLTLTLPKEPQSGDAFIEDFTMQPEIQWCFCTDQKAGEYRPAISFAQVGVATAARRAMAS